MGRGRRGAGGAGGSVSPVQNPEAGPAVEKKSKKLHNLRLLKAINPLGPTANADCYTCRRRRVRCDRGLPTCRKCAKAEYGCAGYKKGFRWVGGIASRGKMMGKRTFDEEEAEEEDGKEKGRDEGDDDIVRGDGLMMVVGNEPPYTEMPASEEGVGQSGEMGMGELILDSPHISMLLAENYKYNTPGAIPALYSQGLPEGVELDPLDFLGIDFVTEPSGIMGDTLPEETQETSDNDINSLPLVTTSCGNSLDFIAATATKWSYYFNTSSNYSYSRARARSGRYYRIVPNKADIYGMQYTLSLCVEPPAATYVSGSTPPESIGSDISIASLVDFYVSTPLAAPSMIGFLDATARYYLSYFDQVCGIFLLFDRHPLNPYHELLLSTLHFSEPALLTTILAVAARYHANAIGHHYNSSGHRPDIIYYNQALNFLNEDLQDEDRMLEDTTLASVLFFLFYETMDSGLNTWRVHLGGARKLVELKYGRMQQGRGQTLTDMQAFVLHSIALFDIIGSTLVTDRQPSVLSPSTTPTPTSISTALTHLDTTVLPILTQGELFCFLACPPTLLHLILKTTLLSSHPYLSTPYPPHHPPTEFHHHRTHLLDEITSFDPTPWLNKHNSQSTITADRDDLLHHVEAYKTAVLIYLYRSLYLPHELVGEGVNVNMEHLAEMLFYHLDQIPTKGSLYKGTVWPCFIAGTEARSNVQKNMVRRHFGRLWEVLYCQNVRNGMNVLEALWREKEAVVGEVEEEGEEDGAAGEEMEKEIFGQERSGWGVEISTYTSKVGRTGRVGGSSEAGSLGSTSSPGRGQDWKGYLKRKGVEEWLFI